MSQESYLTPREIVSELDKYIVGQKMAKRAVGVALRNRWRRQKVSPELRDEISPKNILMMGPTGVGKTEIARRLAKLAQAPFVKVEASKFTEVGYVGRDVESMIRDLTEIAVNMVTEEETVSVNTRARELAEDKLIDLLVPTRPVTEAEGDAEEARKKMSETKKKMRKLLWDGKLDEREVEIEITARSLPIQVFSQAGVEEMDPGISEMIGSLMPKKSKVRKVKVPEAMDILTEEEARKLIDTDKVTQLALRENPELGDNLHRRDRQGRREKRRLGPRRFKGGSAEGSSPHNRGEQRHHEARHGEDRPHTLHRSRGVSRLEAVRPDTRAPGALPDKS